MEHSAMMSARSAPRQPRACHHCGRSFTPPWATSKQRYCSQACSYQASARAAQPEYCLRQDHAVDRRPNQRIAGNEAALPSFVRRAILRRWNAERDRVTAFEARRAAEWLAERSREGAEERSPICLETR